MDCGSRYDCAECQEWAWYIYDGDSQGHQNDRQYDVTSSSFQQAVDLVLSKVTENPTCEEESDLTTVTPLPNQAVSNEPTPTRGFIATPGWESSRIPSFTVYPADDFGSYLKGPTLSVWKLEDSKVNLLVQGSPRKVRKQPERCLEPDPLPDGQVCQRWEEVVSSTLPVPAGHRLRYRVWPYSGAVRPGAYSDDWIGLPANGQLEVTVDSPGFWTFEAVQERLDGTERTRSATRTLALGYGDWVRALYGTPSPSDVGSDHPLRDNPVIPDRDGSLDVDQPATATPLPTLTDSRVRPAAPVLVSVSQDFSSLGKAKVVLGASVPVGTTVEYRYWPHSGFLPNTTGGKWPWRTVSNWDTSSPGVRKVFYRTDTASWHKFESGLPVWSVWDFQVRVKRVVGGELVYSEPSAVKTVAMRGSILPTATPTP